MSYDVVCLGEAMGEIAFSPDGQTAVSVGGDTMNTAIYLARQGCRAAFASSVGPDPFGQKVAALLQDNDVSDALLATARDAMTGLYSITTDTAGERQFHYWRSDSAARQTLRQASDEYLDQLIQTRCLYLSGITLWVLKQDIDVLFSRITALKASGGKLAFDSNFRPQLWQGREDRARALFAEVASQADLLLPTFDDEQALWGDQTPDATITRLRALGIATIIVKLGAEGCVIAAPDGTTTAVPVSSKVMPLDTTAAGDSFNAGFLAALIHGQLPQRAAREGHDLAGRVICHRGAIIPKTNM